MNDLLLKFIKFGVVGFSGVFVDFGVTWLLKDKLGVNKYTANSTGFMLAVVSNYILNRIWTFQSQDPNVAWQFTQFLLISIVGLGINNGIIYLLTERKWKLNFYIAKIAATAVVTFWNFGANILFTFA